MSEVTKSEKETKKVAKLKWDKGNEKTPIADEDGYCTVNDLLNLYQAFVRLTQLKLRSYVGFRVNVNINKLKSLVKAYQTERDKYIEEHGFKGKDGKKILPETDKELSEKDKEKYPEVYAKFSEYLEDLAEQKEDIPKDFRSFYITEESSDFPEDAGCVPAHFKIIQDFGLVKDTEDPYRSKNGNKKK